jgi:hypothetical protein
MGMDSATLSCTRLLQVPQIRRATLLARLSARLFVRLPPHRSRNRSDDANRLNKDIHQGLREIQRTVKVIIVS